MNPVAILMLTMIVGLFVAAALDELAMRSRAWWERRR